MESVAPEKKRRFVRFARAWLVFILAVFTAYYLFPRLAWGLSPLLSLDIMFFYPQLAFPAAFVVGISEVAREKTIPALSLAYWAFIGVVFAALIGRLELWKTIVIAYLLLVPAAVLFSYILGSFGLQVQLDGP